jgi:hypothetical protein
MYLVLLMQPGIVDAEEDLTSGNYYLNACKEFMSLINGEPVNNLFKAGICAGWVNGTNGTHTYWAKRSDGPICTPDAVTVGQLVRIFMKYLEENPERLHENANWLYEDAMRGVYPCQRD